MNKKQLRKSRYLKQADCDPPVALTIEKVEDEDVEFQGKEPENCSVMYFKETEKVLILRPVHADAIADYCGTTDYMGDDESDKWISSARRRRPPRAGLRRRLNQCVTKTLKVVTGKTMPSGVLRV